MSARGGASGTGVGGTAGNAGVGGAAGTGVAGAGGTAVAGAGGTAVAGAGGRGGGAGGNAVAGMGGTAVAGMGGNAVAGSGGTTACTASGSCCKDSDCTGLCQTCSPTTHTCGPATNVDDPNGRCAGTCDATGACKSRKGQPCNATTGSCIAGTTCAPDGYCCDRACTGSCEACDIAGFQGTCTAVAGAVHSNHTPCAGGSTVCAGSCMGRTDGACVYPTVDCGNGPTCSGTNIVDQSKCNGGACVPPAARACTNNLICAANVCKTACSADADCTGGTFCQAGACRRPAVAVTAGVAHTCALLSDGSVQCWGLNAYGGLGNGSFTSGSPGGIATPGAVTSLGGSATAIAGQGLGTCALLTNGSVRCWGRDYYGELGNGMYLTSGNQGVATPGTVMGLARPATKIAAGYSFACALLDDNTIWCWGMDYGNELGDGMQRTDLPNGSATPVQVIGLGAAGTITGIAAGLNTACALTSNGYVYCWGANSNGSCGTGSFTDVVLTPSIVNLFSVMAVVSGNAQTCAIVTGGAVKCWGMNNNGQCGIGSFTPASPYGISAPAALSGSVSATALSAGPGANHTCALTAAGTIYCWGGNNSGELGDGTTSTVSPYGKATPVQVAGLPLQATGLVAGGAHSCALLKNGSVWCWGSNDSGQLGTGNFANSSAPLQVLPW